MFAAVLPRKFHQPVLMRRRDLIGVSIDIDIVKGAIRLIIAWRAGIWFLYGMRQAPECLDSAHISVRLRELLKAENRRFYGCSPFAGTGPRVSSTYHTAGRREAIVSTCSPLLDRFMIKVSTQYAVNLGGNHAVSGLFCVSGR